MLYNQSKYSLAWPWNFGNSSSKTRVFLLSDHVSSGSDLNAPLGQLLEPISSSETRDVKPGLERKSSNLVISGPGILPSSSWLPTAPPPCSWPSGGTETFENGSKWFSMTKNMSLEAKIKSLEDSEQNLQFHYLKSFLASYSPSTLFLTFRWVWDFWKWFQMIAHT